MIFPKLALQMIEEVFTRHKERLEEARSNNWNGRDIDEVVNELDLDAFDHVRQILRNHGSKAGVR